MVASLDDRIAVWAATHRIGALNDFFVALGTVERLGAIWILSALALGIAQRRGTAQTIALGVATGVTAFVADAVSFAVKDLTNRERPFEAHPVIHPLYVVHSSSFPAGHAATALAGAVLLSLIAPRFWPLFLGFAAAVCYSRVYVGVHYPTDVLAGAAIGSVVAAAAYAALRLLGHRRPFTGIGDRVDELRPREA
jgi:undecaprenyl-diphosphatase